MDQAYQGNETRQLALDLGYVPVVPPLSTRWDPWEYDRQIYKKHKRDRAAIPETERLPAYLLPLRQT